MINNQVNFEIENQEKNLDNKNNIHDEERNIKNIFRYKFTVEIMKELYIFSKVHQYDKKDDFKEAWNKWIDENSDIVDSEFRRIISLGYNGNIIDKMYKSARYYFRKKSNEKKSPKDRRQYIKVQKSFQSCIDNHILLNLNNNGIKPCQCFSNFCKENMETLKEEINYFVKNNFDDLEEIKDKIKKTYQNRYFILSNKY